MRACDHYSPWFKAPTELIVANLTKIVNKLYELRPYEFCIPSKISFTDRQFKVHQRVVLRIALHHRKNGFPPLNGQQ